MSRITGRPLTPLETFSVAAKLTHALAKCEKKTRESETTAGRFYGKVLIPVAVRMAGVVATPFAALADVFIHLSLTIGKGVAVLFSRPLRICIKLPKELQVSSPLVHLINSARSVTNVFSLSLLCVASPTAAYRMSVIGGEKEQNNAGDMLPREQDPAINERVEPVDPLLQDALRNNADNLAASRADDIIRLRSEINAKDALIAGKDRQLQQLEDELRDVQEREEKGIADTEDLRKQIADLEALRDEAVQEKDRLADALRLKETSLARAVRIIAQHVKDSVNNEPPPMTQIVLTPPADIEEALDRSILAVKNVDASKGISIEEASDELAKTIKMIDQVVGSDHKDRLPQHFQEKAQEKIKAINELVPMALRDYCMKSREVYESILEIQTGERDHDQVENGLSDSTLDLYQSTIANVKANPDSVDNYIKMFAMILDNVKERVDQEAARQRGANAADEVARAERIKKERLEIQRKNQEKKQRQMAAVTYVTKRYDIDVNIADELHNTMNSASLNMIFNKAKLIKSLVQLEDVIANVKEDIEKAAPGTYVETDLYKEAAELTALFNRGGHLRVKMANNIGIARR
jgi:hypothetical protein